MENMNKAATKLRGLPILRNTLLALLLAASSVFAISQPPTDPLEIARSAYENGDFRDASKYLEAVLAQDGGNSALHLALGNCYYQLAQYGKARYHFRKSLRYSPHDTAALWNLKRTREKIGIEIPVEHHWSDNLLYLQSRLSEDQNRILIFSFAFVSSLLLGMRIVGKAPCSDFILSSVMLLTLLFSVFFTFSQRNANEELEFCFFAECKTPNRAIVVAGNVSARAGPGKTFQVVSVLKDGYAFDILQRSGEWIQIHLPNKRIAWIPAGAQETL